MLTVEGPVVPHVDCPSKPAIHLFIELFLIGLNKQQLDVKYQTDLNFL